MFKDIYEASNLIEKESELKDVYRNGIYVFLEHGKKYSESDINEQFISENISCIYKEQGEQIITNKDKLSEIEKFSYYATPTSAKQQPLSVKGQYTLVSNLFTCASKNKKSKDLLTSVDKFYSVAFLESTLRNKLNKDFSIKKSDIKDDNIKSKDVSKIVENFIEDNFEKYYAHIKDSESEALQTKEDITNNFDFLFELWDKIISDNKNVKDSRIYVIFSEFKEQHKFESMLNSISKLKGNTPNLYLNGDCYFATGFSSIYNNSKPFTNFNKEDSFVFTGNDYLKYSDLERHYIFNKYIEMLGVKFGTKNNFNIYTKNNLILENKEKGSMETRFYVDMNDNNINIVSERPILNNSENNRKLDIIFPYLNKGEIFTKKIEDANELEKLIFTGDSQNGIPHNMLFTNKGANNSTVQNIFYIGDGYNKSELTKKIIKELNDFNEFKTNSLKLTIDTISKTLFNNSKFGFEKLSYSITNYQNMYYFWKTLRKEFLNDKTIDTNLVKVNQFYDKFQLSLKHGNSSIDSDEEFIFIAFQLIKYIFVDVNKLNKDNEKYTDNSLQLFLQSNNPKQLLNRIEKMIDTENYRHFKDESKYKSEQYTKKIIAYQNYLNSEEAKLHTHKQNLEVKNKIFNKKIVYNTREKQCLNLLKNYIPKNTNISNFKDFMYLGLFSEEVMYKSNKNLKSEEI